jgi:endonuclease/exonuclease/phosphatase family metal-dependent hydrolase
MRILAWNCNLPPWVFDRKKRRLSIAAALININPEIICLQEVFFKKDADFLIEKLKDFYFEHSFYHKNLLIISKIPILKSQKFIFKNQGSFFSSAIFDAVYKKGFQVIFLENNFCIINTHLLSACGSVEEVHQTTREKQVEEICQKIVENNSKKIILGDFNFTSLSEPFKKLIKHGFKEYFDENIKTHGDKKLDHVFVKDVKYINKEVVFGEKQYSDHKGLLIEI